MAKTIKQFRFYGDNEIEKNYPDFQYYKAKLNRGTAFSDCYPITQIGIQTIPGTKFYLNDGDNPIIIGPTGIYELNLEGFSSINKLTFDDKSLRIIEQNPTAYLIIDMLCGD